MTIDVEAKTINDKTVTFECLFCWSKYKKNGQPYKTAKRVIHKHGSNSNLNNRIINRTGHCLNTFRNFNIHITDNTERL